MPRTKFHHVIIKIRGFFWTRPKESVPPPHPMPNRPGPPSTPTHSTRSSASVACSTSNSSSRTGTKRPTAATTAAWMWPRLTRQPPLPMPQTRKNIYCVSIPRNILTQTSAGSASLFPLSYANFKIFGQGAFPRLFPLMLALIFSFFSPNFSQNSPEFFLQIFPYFFPFGGKNRHVI